MYKSSQLAEAINLLTSIRDVTVRTSDGTLIILIEDFRCVSQSFQTVTGILP
jgi:hypothetical protein